MVDLNKCKKGDKLLSKHGTILTYVMKLDPRYYYSHVVRYPNGSSGTRIDDGHVYKNPKQRLDSDEDIVLVFNVDDLLDESEWI